MTTPQYLGLLAAILTVGAAARNEGVSVLCAGVSGALTAGALFAWWFA